MNGYLARKRSPEAVLIRNADRSIGTSPGDLDMARGRLILDEKYIIRAFITDRLSPRAIAHDL